MKKNIKKVLLPFILMIIFNLGAYYLTMGRNFGEGYSPHVGIIFISGLLFGPYGAVGAVLGNTVCDLARGYNLELTVTSEIISIGVSYLAYKLWYEKFRSRKIITKPKLNGTSQLLVFIGSIILCAALYSLLNKKLFYLFYPETMSISFIVGFRYFFNFVNSAFIFGIIGIWLSRYIDFVHVPKKSERKFNKRRYAAVGALLVVSLLAVSVTDYYFNPRPAVIVIEILVITGLLAAYLTRPFDGEVRELNYVSIPEKTMNIFLVATLLILILGYFVASDNVLVSALHMVLPLNFDEVTVLVFLMMDIFFAIFFVPSFAVLRYVEKNVINPIVSFSKIEKFLKKGDKIESDGLIEIYSHYVAESDEIGMLARSYTNLINYVNEYISSIHEIEGEKQRIEAELDIAERIQKSSLPTEKIDNGDYMVYGFSKPAKEVGGDFYDYYEIDDENLAIVIGDASGKGVPAAILATITQAVIKQILETEKDPSRVLFSLNNQLCENNSESMFITLWLGIYNKKTEMLRFSNAGHNPPLIVKNDRFEELELNTGIVLGIMEDFEFVTEEIPLSGGIVSYTDGITDAVSSDKEFYGIGRLIDIFDNNAFGDDVTGKLLKDIEEFTEGEDQFDDMTVLILENQDKSE